MNASTRSGFSLAELLVVVVLGGIVTASALEVLLTNQRISSTQMMQVKAQQSVRAGMDILTQELREVSANGGDLLSMDSNSVSIRSMGALGIVCALDLSAGAKLEIRPVGKGFASGDSILVYVEGAGGAEGAWLPGLVSTVNSSTACAPAANVQAITLPGIADTLSALALSVGAPVRAFRHVSYSLESVGGEWYLARATSGGDPQLLAGPFLGPNDRGVTFEYLDGLGAPKSVGTDVSQIRITVRVRSKPSAESALATDSLASLVYLRN